MKQPQYPIFIPSKSRFDSDEFPRLTADLLAKTETPFRLVIEPDEFDGYARRWGDDKLLVLPFANLGQGSIPARNWIMDYARDHGYFRHWQLDDNIRAFSRLYAGRRHHLPGCVALRICEDFTDRYENIAISGLNYACFAIQQPDGPDLPPFVRNVHVYSCMLIRSDLPFRWRGRYNEDTDLCLQVLSAGWCTVLLNAVSANKTATMTMRGGNTDTLYRGDGRLVMAKELQRRWPKVVEVTRRWGRPQHMVFDSWKRFDTPLIRKPDAVIPTEPDDYGLVLVTREKRRSRPRKQRRNKAD